MTIVKTFTTTSLLALFAAITPSVRGHGMIQRITEGSNTYLGLQDDWNKPDGSPILITDYLIPNYNVNSGQIACGINPKPAQSLAQVSPGSTLNINWVTHGDNTDQPQKHWTHNEGTHRAFIGPCIGSCQTTDPTQVEWTELPAANVGWQTWNGNNWPVSVLAAGNTWSVSIPDVPSGDYLLRDELTALHYSTTPYQDYDAGLGHGYGTEFYPSCIALHVNNGGGSFNMGQAMKFPGAYTDNEVGHYNPNLWTDPSSVVISSVNSYARSGGSAPNSGGSTSGSTSSSGSSGDTSSSGSTSSSGTPNNTSSGPTCSSRRKKRSAKFARRHHAQSH